MRRDYFYVDGEKYYTGTVFKLMNKGEQVEATFIYYDTEYKNFVYKLKGCTWGVYDDLFQSLFVEVTDKVDNSVRVPQTKTMKDSEIDGLFIGWLWYIFLMAISVIFKDCIGLWILFSYIFFSWRAKKIKEEGTYVER